MKIRPLTKILSLGIAGLLVSTAAFAQPAPPPPAAPRGVEAPPAPTPDARGPEASPPPLDADAPPPPPRGPGRGPRGDRAPPPPLPGAFIHIDRGADGSLKLDVHCVETGSTKDCADITAQLLDKLNSAVKPK